MILDRVLTAHDSIWSIWSNMENMLLHPQQDGGEWYCVKMWAAIDDDFNVLPSYDSKRFEVWIKKNTSIKR